MTGLTADKMTNLYADLTSQISKSVKNISRKSASDFVASAQQNQNAEPSVQQTGFSGYVFSYLEPSSLYNLHRISADLKNDDKLREQNRQKNQAADNERQAEAERNGNHEQVDGISFASELQNFSKPDAQFVTKLYRQNFLNKISEAPLFLSGSFTANDAGYANKAYNYTFNLNNAPDMRIEYMHKYNRNFDYRI